MKKKSEIVKYKEFVDTLNANLNSFEQISKDKWRDVALQLVDGLASDEVRRLVNLETRKKHGIFFTKSDLAQSVFKKLKPNFNDNSIIYDPACGAGNLIIAAFNFVLEKKIKLNNREHFYGTDIHKEFIEAAKLRCSINQLLFKDLELPQFINCDFKFSQLDGLKFNEYYEKATDIVINPPFNLIAVEEDLKWSKGKVSSAALFIDKVIQNVKPGTCIYAILPDVLRSGSRYEKWRQMIQAKCKVGTAHLLGQFDEYADVDVFAIKLVKRAKNHLIQPKQNPNPKIEVETTAKFFEISVGPVVDNRDPKKGLLRKYIVSKGLKGWTKQIDTKLKRKHQGRSFKSPFVVVKRTSRMGDSQRAIATIINFSKPVYVDNHLIILKPKSNTLKDCKRLLKSLKNSKTDEWLNKQIRCRHLTVKIISKIPIWE